MPYALDPVPTEQSLSRVPRALKILGLQAGLHNGQKFQTGLSSLEIDAPVSGTNKETVPQPQLTLLVRAETGCPDNHSYGGSRYC